MASSPKVVWRAAALPRWTATESLWNKKSPSQDSPDRSDVRLLNSVIKSDAARHIGPSRLQCKWDKLMRSGECGIFSILEICSRLHRRSGYMDRMIEVARGKSVDHGDIPRKTFARGPWYQRLAMRAKFCFGDKTSRFLHSRYSSAGKGTTHDVIDTIVT